MASTLSTTASASVVAKGSANLPHYYNTHGLSSRVSFPLSSSSKPKLRFFSTSAATEGLRPEQRNSSPVLKAQLNEVSADRSSNAAPSSPPKSEVSPPDSKDPKPPREPCPSSFATEESISQFITQVSSLLKLVDSRDIAELKLKQLDCELIIRKKEALPQPPSAAPFVMMSSPALQHVMPPPPRAASAAASSPAAAAKSAKSSLPSLKCPMAGTFYRSPAPGEPPFVKVGDKVQKGQVLCLVEAMKLMNEIEADQSGTIVEILAEDGKPVSVDMPLFVIGP